MKKRDIITEIELKKDKSYHFEISPLYKLRRTDSCKHPCTQSAQRLQFACSYFHNNEKPFLIGCFGLV